jgi:CubicO group peptidase (beta-lactamase class C family)
MGLEGSNGMTVARIRRLAGVGALLVVAAMLPGCTVGDATSGAGDPTAPPTRDRTGETGDPELLEAIGGSFQDPYDRVAVALVDGDDVRTAFVDADETTQFELGSITKPLTGLLLAVAIERGEVELDDPVGEHLELGASDVASVTLEQLATHRSGLPELPSEITDADPFPDTDGALVAQATTVEIAPETFFAYSNVGVALLGHALAAAAGAEYAELLEQRVLGPAGMDDAVIVETAEQVPAGLEAGYTLTGEPVEPWTYGEYAPAAAVAAAVGDLVALALAVTSGPFADSPALDPLAEFDSRRAIGYLWFVEELSARTVTGHGGQTGGYSCALMVDRAAGTASVVLWNGAGDPYDVALRVLLLADG